LGFYAVASDEDLRAAVRFAGCLCAMRQTYQRIDQRKRYADSAQAVFGIVTTASHG
jgi:hypothetical protein